MNRSYWEAVAANYESEVMSVLDNDALGLVRAGIEQAGLAAPCGSAADLGCGVGKFTPYLADRFQTVEACDLSSVGLAATRELCRSYSNVSYWRLDLAKDPVPFEPVDFALCVNVLLMPCLDERLRAWRAVTNQVASGGALLLVVPSQESAQMEVYHAVDASLDEGDDCEEALRRSLPEQATVVDLQQGIHQLDGLRTKHYLRDEVEEMLASHEMAVTELRKLEYRSAPDALPDSWDWLALARRK